ncbi:Peptidoglycan/xylan/chitin deacetylase, PgdA/CDA1 family [Anaerovirgula multivorans]|uniref:Peptidoglycan/xylan/chitin deacetylase, PgdA/CDA1 family n=1 Tax=Anaerovirgula multivorans TaxID=312168 RepID=A0A239EB53_9FIRM|nr:polysaccharide deacetylase family protein [Anaerovirgula multivorans]SNS41243.1 Peptidoglycan/xylan/chitin deacetylase, PgdA/CDA1 family [Anaerovirgula multivorans]
MNFRVLSKLLLALLIVSIILSTVIDNALAQEVEVIEEEIAEVEEVVDQFNKFADVHSQDTNPHYDSIYRVANAGIMQGFTDEIFDPNKPVTRGELAVISAKMLDIKEAENENFQLNDVHENHWAYMYITLVLQEGLMKTKSPYEFKSEENVTTEEVIHALKGLNEIEEKMSKLEITRGEMAYLIDVWFNEVRKEPLSMPDLIDLYDESMLSTENFIYTLLGKYSPSSKVITTKALADILVEEVELTYDSYLYYRYEINDTANLNILKMYSEGILHSDSNGNLFPNKELTRKEATEIIYKLSNPIIPERPEYIARNHIPVLMYHEINTLPTDGPTGLYVSQDNFIKQLDALKEEGYNTITMDQLYNHWENNVPIPPKPIVLTFDDGYISHYNFSSVELNKRGMTGTFYIISSMVDVDHIRTSNRLKEMYEEGMEIGSHTVTHIDARYSNNARIAKEYKESKEYLEKVIGSEISHFCYPIGGVTPYAKQTLKDLGYKTAVRTTHGKANKSQGMYDLRRIRIDYNDSIRGFLNKIK